MVIKKSVKIRPGVYHLDATESLDEPLIVIQGENIEVDFQHAELIGSNDKEWPNEFYGLAIKVEEGKNIILKNLNVRGYKVGMQASSVDSLQVLNSDFSYNFRQKLYSIRERESLSDWLSYHDNEEEQWLRYGMAVYLKDCDNAHVEGLKVTGGQNGLMLMRCNNGLFYNNEIQFNSGLGIGMYRSSNNQVVYNKLDWNIRGYSHGIYQRGQDSAGILCYEQSNDNVFAYNSATHSGDGFFLWAGNHSMDTGEGGCNGNLIFGNDFSHAPTNCVEVTFSSNFIIDNRLEECRYGVWAGYSWETLILGNEIKGNDYGVAFEHGQDNVIKNNYFDQNGIGIQLWERESQPTDWGYVQNKDVSSRNYQIQTNSFNNVKNPLNISSSKSIAVNDNNQFVDFDQLLVNEKPNRDLVIAKNEVFQTQGWGSATSFKALNHIQEKVQEIGQLRTNSLGVAEEEIKKYQPNLAVQPIDVVLPDDHLRGRQYMLINEWGPYDFKRPYIWLKSIEGDQYKFGLLGPGGSWRVNAKTGFQVVSKTTGSFPDSIYAIRDAESEILRLELEYDGPEATNQFGKVIESGTILKFNFYRFEKRLEWEVDWHNLEEALDPLKNKEAFTALKDQQPTASAKTEVLDYRWWGAPQRNVNSDRFATFAKTTFNSDNGSYRIFLTSDDGVRMYLDGDLVHENWKIHESETDEVILNLVAGEHTIEIEHFDASGLASLDFRMEKIIN